MAQRRSSAASAQVEKRPLELLVSRDAAQAKLAERIEKGRELRQQRVGTPEELEALEKQHQKWDAFNAQLLKTIFSTEEMANEYNRSGSIGIISLGGYGPSMGQQIADLYKSIDSDIHRLDSIIERLELIPLGSALQQAPVSLEAPTKERSKKVFVVHGHDEVSKTNLEVFLHEIGLEPVVLHRQADEGMTIIEKFEKHSDVGYAFILLTPDEVAYLAPEEGKADKDRQKEFRARPNVIFEFGYFVGRLTRSRVCCLYRGGVTLPSDVSGLIYKKYETNIDEVGYSIIKDLKAAGYSPLA
jgi:predicted nucleotide-binding protein